MKSRPHWLLGIVLLFLGLLLNPSFLALLFSHNGSIESLSIIGVILCLEIGIIIIGIILIRNRRPQFINLGLAISSTLILLLLSVTCDRFYGAFLKPETANLLFPPYSKAKHHSSEFDLTVSINNLGFRGPNTTILKKKKRVIVIGDSFSFGWGVKQDETWVSLLGARYPEIEFLNFGQGGTHPGDHVQTAHEVIPLLKPDLVLVGVLQANDIHQLMQLVKYESEPQKKQTATSNSESRYEFIRRMLFNVYPNLMERFPRKVKIRDRWLTDSNALIVSFTSEQKARYEGLPLEIQTSFENGMLNPSLIYDAIHHPNYFREAIDTTKETCRTASIRLRDHIQELIDITDQQNAKLVIVAQPNRPYSFPSEIPALQELGFNVAGCDSLNPNSPMYLATGDLSIPVLYPQLSDTGETFYKHDGHWNAEGNRKFAAELINYLDTLEAWKPFLTSSTF